MPVLRATWASGMAAAMLVPEVTTATIRSATREATFIGPRTGFIFRLQVRFGGYRGGREIPFVGDRLGDACHQQGRGLNPALPDPGDAEVAVVVIGFRGGVGGLVRPDPVIPDLRGPVEAVELRGPG